jgi:hypothetical protein
MRVADYLSGRHDALRFSRSRGDFDAFSVFVEQCMSVYDLNGFTADPWASAPWAHSPT